MVAVEAYDAGVCEQSAGSEKMWSSGVPYGLLLWLQSQRLVFGQYTSVREHIDLKKRQARLLTMAVTGEHHHCIDGATRCGSLYFRIN
jgi:hypothetical protein